MKHLLAATVLAGSRVFAGLASAENALFASTNASVQVTFYNADPATGADALATARVNNSPASVTIDGIEEATYATITYEGEAYTFELAESGKNKNDVMLELAATSAEDTRLVSNLKTISLTELMSALASEPTLLERLKGSNSVG